MAADSETGVMQLQEQVARSATTGNWKKQGGPLPCRSQRECGPAGAVSQDAWPPEL